MISRILIGMLLSAVIFCSIFSRVIEPHGHVIFPFFSWDIFSGIARFHSAYTFEVQLEDQTCILPDCPLLSSNKSDLSNLSFKAYEFAENPISENPLLKEMESKLFILFGKNVRYELIEFQVDVKTLERDESTRKIIYTSRLEK